MSRLNAVPEAQTVFGTASAGGSMNGGNVGVSFGTFTDGQREVAFDSDGSVLSFFGIGPGVLGITLKSVQVQDGSLLDFLVVVNTQPGALLSPGTSREALFRSTLLHELGHAFGAGHSPVGMANQTTFGLAVLPPSRIATMYPFRLPVSPGEGGTLELDDRAAITGNYPLDTSGLGTISGSVRAASGAAINAIAVRAVSSAGEHVGVLSNGDGFGQGRFRIQGVPPGRYRVLIEGVNRRGGVSGDALASGAGSLGSEPFALGVDEFWQPGDTYDPALDDPVASVEVAVRAGRDTGSIDFVLNGAPLFDGQNRNETLGLGDSRVSDAAGGFHFADYYVFQANAGQGVTITATGAVGPQLLLLRPTDLGEEDSATPPAGATATITANLAQTGVYTLIVSARATTGNFGGSGSYSLSLAGTGLGLAPPPAVTPARATAGPANPGDQDLGGPVCGLGVLQVRLEAPSMEQLWVDQVVVRASGSGDDRRDLESVRLVRDRNGDGRWDGTEPVLATGNFDADNGQVAFQTALTLAAGETLDLLVVYDVTVPAPPVPAGGWLVVLLLVPLLRRRRRALLGLVLLLAIAPMGCGGGGAAVPSCNFPFNPDADRIVDFTARIDPGDILAFTPSQVAAVQAVAGSIVAGTLRVSN